MASIYTYDQFEQAARQAGLFDKFSEADLNLARRNADAGMSILKYKQDWANATTDEARALANLGAENIRSSYGNYTGGQDGGSFHLNPMSPSSFQQEEAPKYESRYDGQIQDLYDKQKNYGQFRYDTPAPTYESQYGSQIQDLYDKQKNYGQFQYDTPAPTYESQYGGQIQDLWEQQKNYGEFTFDQAAPAYENRYDDQTQQLINAIMNRGEFSYDPAKDPSAQAYQKQYAREGKRATQDALAAASLATGGAPSSYAVSAATQAGDYYASQMADKIPELYQQAYNRYLDEYNTQMQNLGMLQNAEQLDYAKFQDRMNQYNTDRNFAYGQWQDGLNQLNANLQTGMALEQQDYEKFLQQQNQWNTDRNFAYGQWQDGFNQLNANLQTGLTLEQQEYDKFLNQQNQWNTDRNFAYGQWQDGLNKVNADLQTGLALEQQDYDRFLQDRNQHNIDREFDYGQLLDELSSQSAERQEALNKAQIAGNYGDYSFLNDLGIDTTNNPADWERQYQMALLKAEMGDYSGLQELGIDTSNNPAEREWQYQMENDQWERNYQMALLKAQYGDYSGLRELGVNIPEDSSSGGGYWYSGPSSDPSNPGYTYDKTTSNAIYQEIKNDAKTVYDVMGYKHLLGFLEEEQKERGNISHDQVKEILSEITEWW